MRAVAKAVSSTLLPSGHTPQNDSSFG